MRSFRKERATAHLPERVKNRLAANGMPRSEHLSADLLCAYSENSLTQDERQPVLAHLADCGACREALALSAPGEDFRSNAQASKWRWLAATAAAIVVGLLVWKSPQKQATAPAYPAQERIVEQTLKPRLATAVPALVERVHEAQSATPKRKNRVVLKIPSHLEAASVPADRSQAPTLPKAPQIDLALPPRSAQPSSSAALLLPEQAPPGRRFARASAMARPISPLWRADSAEPGMLLRSMDGGATWQAIRVGGESRLLAVYTVKDEVWAGGSGGALFRSRDGGTSWTHTPVRDGTSTPSDDILTIRAADVNHVTVTTASGQTWATEDGGQHWVRTNE